MKLRLWVAVLTVLPCIAGCRSEMRTIDVQHALTRVNENINKISAPLMYKPAVVSFRFRDERGKSHRFNWYPAVIIYQPPRCLYFDIKNNMNASVARVGSNDSAYWMWIEPELNKMWWGEWDRERTGDQRLPVQPAEVLAALALRPLDIGREGAGEPELDLAHGNPKLIYREQAGEGARYVSREVVLDRYEPGLPIRIIQRRSDGAITMDASLTKYARVGVDGPYTPRQYLVKWPLDGAEMALDISGAQLRPEQAPFCVFPTDPPVAEVERITGGAAAAERGALLGSPR